MPEPIELCEPDPDWPMAFVRERERLWPCFVPAPHLIEHIGSTAVPGLLAKPIIDIIVLVGNLRSGKDCTPALEQAGYQYRPDYIDQTKLFLRKLDPVNGRRTHHLHIHDNAKEVHRHLLFRDALRADGALRDPYSRLKQDLAQRYRDDRMAYSRHKTAFIDSVVLARNGPPRRVAWNP